MKVLHISGARSWGGNEQQLMDLIPELKTIGVSSIVFGVDGYPLQERCLETDVPFFCSKTEKLNKFSNYRFLKELVAKERPDVIHLHTSDSVTVYVIADVLYRLKVPTVFSKKGMGSSMSTLSRYKYNYKNIKAILCVSKAVESAMKKDVISEKNYDKLKVVYEGIRINRINNTQITVPYEIENMENSKAFKLVNIANHTAAKDLETLIKAVAFMVYKLSFRDFKLFQIGAKNKYTEELVELTKELKVEEYITFLGFTKNATDSLPMFDLFVMSSQREGLPLTIYESFYKKTPVVSTKAGGIPEIITDGENGFLAEIKDYKSLGEKCVKLLGNQELRQQFSELSFNKFISDYTAESAAKHMLKIYKEISC